MSNSSTPLTPAQHQEYVLRFADTALIASQRLCEWIGHAPELEEELALANLGLDLLGQARELLTHAGSLSQPSLSEDDLAMHRSIGEFRNLSLVEQPNGDFAFTIVRQMLLSAWQELLYSELLHSNDSALADFAKQRLPEVAYHWRYASNWFLRLGDGTEESHRRGQEALDSLWRFTGELFDQDAVDAAALASGIGPDLSALQPLWLSRIATLCNESTLFLPTAKPSRWFGKQGDHGEALGYLLADMQSLPRAHNGARW